MSELVDSSTGAAARKAQATGREPEPGAPEDKRQERST
jgi:hypothetical protein